MPPQTESSRLYLGVRIVSPTDGVGNKTGLFTLHRQDTDGRQKRRVQAFPMRYFYRYEVEHLLARAGFVVEHVYADYDRTPYGSTYPGELIFVARKVAEVVG